MRTKMSYKELCDIQDIGQAIESEEFGFLRIWVDFQGRTREIYSAASNTEAERKIANLRKQYRDDILTITYSPMSREQAKSLEKHFDNVAAMTIESTPMSPGERIADYLRIANMGKYDSNSGMCFSAAKKLMEKYGSVSKPNRTMPEPTPNVEKIVEDVGCW